MNLKHSRFRYKISNWLYSQSAVFKVRRLFYSQWISRGDLCIDVGANVGNRTSVFLTLGASVVAIEPLEKCQQILKLKFGKSIHLVGKAVGAQVGKMRFYEGNTSTLSTLSSEWKKRVSDTRFVSETWRPAREISVTTLQEIIAQHGVPQFIKIDVEGFEYEVLMGLHTAVPTISLEYTVPEMSDSLEQCLSLLHKLSREYKYNYSVGERMELCAAEWMSYEQMEQHVSSAGFLAGGCGDLYATLA